MTQNEIGLNSCYMYQSCKTLKLPFIDIVLFQLKILEDSQFIHFLSYDIMIGTTTQTTLDVYIANASCGTSTRAVVTFTQDVQYEHQIIQEIK